MTSGTTKFAVPQMLDMLYHYEKASIGTPDYHATQAKITAKLNKYGIKINEYTHFVITQKEPHATITPGQDARS